MSKTTPILLTTKTLSSIVDALRAAIGPTAPSKPRALNMAAAVIAGDRHDWGYLTGSDAPIVARDSARFAPLLAQQGWIVVYDERDDWSPKDPCGIFATREDAIAFVMADEAWWKHRDHPAERVQAGLEAEGRYSFRDEDDDDASPYSIAIQAMTMRPGTAAPSAAQPTNAGNTAKTVGYQIVDSEGNTWGDRPSFEIVSSYTAATAEMLEARAREPNAGWELVTIKEGDVEDPNFVP